MKDVARIKRSWGMAVLGLLLAAAGVGALAAWFGALRTAPLPVVALIFGCAFASIGGVVALSALAGIGPDGKLPETTPRFIRRLHGALGWCAGLGFALIFTAIPLSDMFAGSPGLVARLAFSGFALLFWTGLLLAVVAELRKPKAVDAAQSAVAADDWRRLPFAVKVATVLAGLCALAVFACVFSVIALGGAGPVRLTIPLPASLPGGFDQVLGRGLFAAPAGLLWFLFVVGVRDAYRWARRGGGASKPPHG